jgi:hypothetical protein
VGDISVFFPGEYRPDFYFKKTLATNTTEKRGGFKLFYFLGGRVSSHLCVLVTYLEVPWNNVTNRQNLSEIEKKNTNGCTGFVSLDIINLKFIFQSEQEMYFFSSQVWRANKIGHQTNTSVGNINNIMNK